MASRGAVPGGPCRTTPPTTQPSQAVPRHPGVPSRDPAATTALGAPRYPVRACLPHPPSSPPTTHLPLRPCDPEVRREPVLSLPKGLPNGFDRAARMRSRAPLKAFHRGID